MTLYYIAGKIAGQDVDAQREVNDLFVKLGAGHSNPTRMQLYALIDAMEAFQDGGAKGFPSVAHKWTRSEYDDLFLYSSGGLLMAINVPGGGRTDTPDLCLIGVRCVEADDQGELAAAFARDMAERRKKGERHECR
jgi:hypothetical protein